MTKTMTTKQVKTAADTREIGVLHISQLPGCLVG